MCSAQQHSFSTYSVTATINNFSHPECPFFKKKSARPGLLPTKERHDCPKIVGPGRIRTLCHAPHHLPVLAFSLFASCVLDAGP